MNIKVIRVFILFVMMINAHGVFCQKIQMPNQMVADVVRNSMGEFLNNIPDKYLGNYGIKNKEEINKIIVGMPLDVFVLFEDSLKFTDTWRVPLILDDEYTSLFTVSKDETGEYNVVDFGATVLAQEISKKGNNNNLRGLLRVYQLKKDFFICQDDDGNFEFHPIPNPDNQSYTLTEVLNLIKK